MLAMMGVDEIEDLLLTIGERFAHSVQVNTFLAEGKYRDRGQEKNLPACWPTRLVVSVGARRSQAYLDAVGRETAPLALRWARKTTASAVAASASS